MVEVDVAVDDNDGVGGLFMMEVAVEGVVVDGGAGFVVGGVGFVEGLDAVATRSVALFTVSFIFDFDEDDG